MTTTTRHVTHLTLGTTVLALLLRQGILREDDDARGYVLPLGNGGPGYGLGAVQVTIAEGAPDLLAVLYDDGSSFTNHGEAC